ncbi:MAG TPA: hypothetical protein DIU00_17455 [Phycisphaerales bacterium]|nr:hypothetical protein [Phycisphaerales bacterium]
MIAIALPSRGPTLAARQHFFLAWPVVTLDGNYFAARMDFRALLPNILQLFAKNTRIFFFLHFLLVFYILLVIIRCEKRRQSMSGKHLEYQIRVIN